MNLADGNGPTTTVVATTQEIPTPVQVPNTGIARFSFWFVLILIVIGILLIIARKMKGDE